MRRLVLNLAPLAASQVPHIFTPSRLRRIYEGTAATTSMEEFLAPPSTRSRLKTRLVQTSNPKLPLAGDGSEPGAAITDPAVAKAWTYFFQQCDDSSRTFAFGDRSPSFDDIQPLLPKLAELGCDDDRSTRLFVDSEDRKWVVKISFTKKRVQLIAVGTSSGVLYSCTHVPSMYVRAFTVQNMKSNFAPTLPYN